MTGRCAAVALALLCSATLANANGMIHRSKYDITNFQKLEKRLGDQNTLSLGWFGYAEDGRMTVKVEATGLTDRTLIEGDCRTRGVGFIVARAETAYKALRKDINVCDCNATLGDDIDYLDLELETPEPAAGSVQPIPSPETTPAMVFIGRMRFKDEAFRTLSLYQCGATAADFKDVTLRIQIEQLNPVGRYLQVGDRFLPEFYLLMSVLTLLCLVKWVQWMRADPEHTFKIHYLMGTAVALKAGSLFFEAIRYYHYRENGGTSDVYEGMYYTFNLLKGAMLFAMMVLIGSGWSYLKPCLTEKEKIVLLIVIPLQVTTSVLTIVLDEYFAKHPEENTETFQSNLTIISFLTCCIVIIPIIWSMKKLRAAQNQDGKVARNLLRLKKFETLYGVVLVYVYSKTLLCEMILSKMMPAGKTWVPVVLGEVCVLASFIFMGMRFKPEKENPFSQLDDDDIEEAGPALEREMRELQEDRAKLEEANQPYPVPGGMDDRRPASTLVQKKNVEADF